MSFSRAMLARALAHHRRVARVVVAQTAGSAPRDVGAAMLVWPEGQDGTIGGGALELEAADAARTQLAGGGASRNSRHALGPDLGQCCGGAVTLLTELFDTNALDGLADMPLFARPTPGAAPTEPLDITRLRAQARSAGARPRPRLIDGWFVEPLAPPSMPVWIWGAGHVGRALAATLAPLPDVAVTWTDTAPNRFPPDIPDGVTTLPAPELPRAMALAPKDAHHLILTYSHALDLAVCHAALSHGFASAGLIGSATKWARFRKRLQQMGHSPAQIERITCPIGDPSLGKHPQAIAVGVATGLLRQAAQMKNTDRGTPRDREDRGRAALT